MRWIYGTLGQFSCIVLGGFGGGVAAGLGVLLCYYYLASTTGLDSTTSYSSSIL